MAALLLWALLAVEVQDPVQVRARLTRAEIHAGETAILRIDVETGGERAEIQRFHALPPGLEVRSSRDFDQRQFSLPGGTRRFISREYVLRARAAGRYRIPAVEVVVGARTYTTRSQLLTVLDAPRAGGDTGTPTEDVVLRAWLDADTVYVGEQVTLQAEAMFSQNARLRLRRAPEYEPPSPSGFWIHDLPDRRSPATRIVGQRRYEVQLFRRALFPLTPGEYEIPPARLEYEMRRGLLYAPETYEMKSDPLPLVVLPVPGPQPPEFTGAVGRYTMNGRLEPTRVPMGEATVLTVDVAGEGNVKALPPPRLPELEGMDVFPPSEDATTEVQGSLVQGRKQFSWVLIPRRAGEIEVPEIRYAYYDPDQGFATATVAPMTITVTPGAAAAGGAGPPPVTLRYLQVAPAGDDPLSFVRSSWFAAAQTVPILLFAFALGWRRRAGRRSASVGALRRRRRDAIQALHERAGETDRHLFGDAEAMARDWLAERLGISSREVGAPGALEASGTSPETAAALRALFDRLAAARYAPEPPGIRGSQELVRALGRLLDRVEREVGRRRPGSGPTGAAGIGRLLLALGLVSGTVSTAAAQDPDSLFRAGLSAYDQERYHDAAAAFHAYLEARPGDAGGWYNLGTAQYRIGATGRAVWAWLHVPGLDPRHEDVRHNLRVAGVPPELVARVAPPVPLRTEELLLLASLAWLTTGAGAALWLLRRRTRWAVAGATSLLLALGLGAAAWDSTRGADTLIVLDATTLRAGPTLRADPVQPLEPGVGLRPVERHGAWVRARTLDGREGWVEATTTARL